MTWSIFIAAVFYALGILVGLEIGRAPLVDDCEGCLFDEPEPPYRRTIRAAYRERVN